MSEAGNLQPIRLDRSRRLGDAEMDITPMIDIVFLLLIFFLVASKMDDAASVALPPARHGIAVADDNSVVVLVRKRGGDEVEVARRNGEAFSRDLREQESEIADYVAAGMRGSAPFGRPMQHIILKAERDVKEGDVARVAEAIGKATEQQLLHYAVLEAR
jgi:biopolymer transport protein ExbD